jgi:hypothetical protein
MTDDLVIKILSTLRQEVHSLEKSLSRMIANDSEGLIKFSREQGVMFGVEKALTIVHKILAETEDQLDS